MENYPEDERVLSTPSRRGSLNVRSNAAQEHQKRESLNHNDTIGSLYIFDATIIPITEPQQILNFTPVSTVLRAHVPLSWLSGHSNPLHAGTLLQAKITCVPIWDYHILVARLMQTESLFALERVDQDAYVCHPLQGWVKTSWVEKAAFGAAPAVDLKFLSRNQTLVNHSRKTSSTSITNCREPLQTTAGTKLPQNRRGHMARLSIFESRGKTEEPLDTTGDEASQGLQPDLTLLTVDGMAPDFEPTIISAVDADISTRHATSPTTLLPTKDDEAPLVVEPTQEIKTTDHLSSEHLRRQYLETLYISKTSLAFYAKGPLSRARARARAAGASRSSEDLAAFYSESIVSTKKLDLKYKESIQNKLTSLIQHDDEHAVEGKSTNRKSKRTKLGKDGLWPLEEEYIERWWKSLELTGGSSQTAGALSFATGKTISQLRMRETEMQIILILEILALEARDIVSQQAVDPSIPVDVKLESVDNGTPPELPSILPKKRLRDLKSQLGFLIDRLCIWHSIGSEDAVLATVDQQKSGSTSEQLKDRLREFCKEVVVPFYGSKLPEQCRIICAKMGGTDMAPQRSRSTQIKEPAATLPGAAISRERASNKRNLQRVLSEDDSMRHASPPILSRSATLPAHVGVKREPLERPISRSAMQKSVSFSNREVDLVADARVTAAKRRKVDLVAAQKRELDAAIETLKRPNRSNVAKGFMDDLEQRTKEGRPSMTRTGPIQISATPKRGRAKQSQTEEYDLPAISVASAPSEELVVPSSTAKPRGLSQVSAISRSSVQKRAVLSAIHDTPSRGRPDRIMMVVPGLDGAFDVDDDNGDEHEAGTRNSSSTLVTSTPVKSRLRLDFGNNLGITPMRMHKSQRPVLLTPLEKSEAHIEQAFRDAPEVPERAGKAMDRAMGSKSDAAALSLYESLGWDDDYDL